MHDDKCSSRPSVMTPDLIQQIEVKICENRHFTITDLAEFFPNVSRKICIAGKQFLSDAEMEMTVNNWLQQQVVDFFDTSIQKLVTRYNKCLDSAGCNAYLRKGADLPPSLTQIDTMGYN